MDDAQVLASMVLMTVMSRELQRSNGGDTSKFALSAEQAACCGASDPSGKQPISGYKWMTKVKRQALEFLSQDRPVTKKARREAREILEQMCDGYDNTDDEDVDDLDKEVATYEEVVVEAEADDDEEEEEEEDGEEEEEGEEVDDDDASDDDKDTDFAPNPGDTSDGAEEEEEDSDVEPAE
jgi:hypothetical protein